MSTNQVEYGKDVSEAPSLWEELGILWTNGKKWLKKLFSAEEALEKIYKKPENDDEEEQIKKLRKINLIEFILSLTLVFTFMWAMWWVGIVKDNDNLITT